MPSSPPGRRIFSFRLKSFSLGLELGVRQPSQIIVIDNIDDVSSGCEIVFKSLGPVTNPELMNVDTR